MSETDTLDLNGISERGLGYQATTGLTGFGLPPVSVQWSEGAGDGATFRSRRTLPRDIDIPLEILARNRAHLQELTSRLALALAGGCTLSFIDDDGTTWLAEVHRVGGGEYTYGEDTVGERELSLVLTLRAGDPYWVSAESQVRSVSADSSTPTWLSALSSLPVSASQAIGEIQLTNAGDAAAYPIWEITGPGTNFVAESRTGERISWTGALGVSERLIIDTSRGTVVDGSGRNRYAELAAAPRFWTIPPGTSSAKAQLEDTDSHSRITCSWRPRKWMMI